MNLNKALLLLIVSLSCVHLRADAARVRTPQMAVVNLCKNSTNPHLCRATVMPIVRVGSFSFYKALEAMILATKVQVVKTSGLIGMLLANPNTQKDIFQSLKTCKEQYSSIVDSIEAATTEVAKKSVVEARFKFSGVLSYHASCNDEFLKGQVSPIATDANLIYQLGGNVLDVMKEIEDRENRRTKRRYGNNLPPPPPAMSFANDPCFGVIGICG